MPRHPVRDTLFVTLLAALSFGGSCTSDNTGAYDPHPSNGPYESGPYDRDRDGSYGRDEDRPSRIPRYADIVREGTGKLKWTADLDGTIYVYDRDKDEIRYTGPVRRGTEIVVRPEDDQVAFDDRTVSKENLRKDGFHQMFFAAARNGPDRGWPGRDSPDRDRSNRDDTRPRRPDRPPAVDPPSAVTPTIDLPRDAKRLARGSDTIEVAKLPAGGVVYIFDESGKTVLYRAEMKKGTALRVAASDGKVLANGQTVGRVKIARGHSVGVYLSGK